MLEKDGTLHYTGDGWIKVKLNKKQIEAYKKDKLDLLNLEWE